MKSVQFALSIVLLVISSFQTGNQGVVNVPIIAYVSGDKSRNSDDSDIFTMHLDGSDITNLTSRRAWDFQPAWSADGQRIAFSSNEDGNFNVYVMNHDGSMMMRLTDNSADAGYPSWSPSADKIVFASDSSGNLELYMMNADGSDQHNLTNDPGEDSEPAWSLDGSKIAFASNRYDHNSDIFVLNLITGQIDNLTHNSTTESFPAWSPDGKHLSFISDRGPHDSRIQSGVYVMDVDGSNKIRITTVKYPDSAATWSPDGEKLLFSGCVETTFAYQECGLFTVDPQPDAQPTQIKGTDAGDANPVWQPVGKKEQ